MKRKVLAVLLVMGLCVGTASAQFGFGIVYDPTNYANAVLRYSQLVQQLNQLRQTYTQIVQQYNLAVQMARNLQNMPARYQAQFSQWRNVVAPNTYGNTGTWVNGMNTGLPNTVNTGYQQATTPLLQYNGQVLSGMTPDELNRVKSQYASVELSDGANVTAMAAIGAIRDNAQTIQNQINNLEQDSLSNDPNLNTEVSVLNKINAANVLTLRTLQDSNKLLLSLLEQNVIAAKQQRETTANSINADIARQATLAGNLAQVTSTLEQLAPELPHAVIRRNPIPAASKETQCRPTICNSFFRPSTTCSRRISASSTRWAKICFGCSRPFSSLGSASSRRYPPPVAEAASTLRTSPVFCSPSALDSRWSTTTAIRSPAWGRASTISSRTNRSSWPTRSRKRNCRLS